jgi:hypothetical protein
MEGELRGAYGMQGGRIETYTGFGEKTRKKEVASKPWWYMGG